MNQTISRQASVGVGARLLLLWGTLVILGSLAALTPWLDSPLGLELDVSEDVELADHAVPGGVVVIAAVAGWSASRVNPGGAAPRLAAAVALLAGLWLTATHLPLMLDAVRDQADAGPALLHSVWGPPIAVLAMLAMRGLRGAAAPAPR